ncbi:antitoxin HicB [Arthrobacter mobilis]|uniref:Antitoxin HicB n=1 Tax=Arthrobacter mobilis TaxID=2724944 RepID=A0A7X6K5M7_9MICC|nr:antitoxin HicB [Arthrobacter mobilis]NKX54444.1 antitoxin HicB [Arthrobacter mobilis]
MSDPCGREDLAGFRFHVAWCPEDETYVATVAELPSLSWADGDRRGALCGLERLVERELDNMRQNGEAVPGRAAD